jgi:hypothetical protein
MGLQIKIVKYFSAAEQFSCRAANFRFRDVSGGLRRLRWRNVKRRHCAIRSGRRQKIRDIRAIRG